MRGLDLSLTCLGGPRRVHRQGLFVVVAPDAICASTEPFDETETVRHPLCLARFLPDTDVELLELPHPGTLAGISAYSARRRTMGVWIDLVC